MHSLTFISIFHFVTRNSITPAWKTVCSEGAGHLGSDLLRSSSHLPATQPRGLLSWICAHRHFEIHPELLGVMEKCSLCSTFSWEPMPASDPRISPQYIRPPGGLKWNWAICCSWGAAGMLSAYMQRGSSTSVISSWISPPFLGATAPPTPWRHRSWGQLGCSHQTQAKKAADQTEANITLPRGSVGHCFILWATPNFRAVRELFILATCMNAGKEKKKKKGVLWDFCSLIPKRNQTCLDCCMHVAFFQASPTWSNKQAGNSPQKSFQHPF